MTKSAVGCVQCGPLACKLLRILWNSVSYESHAHHSPTASNGPLSCIPIPPSISSLNLLRNKLFRYVFWSRLLIFCRLPETDCDCGDGSGAGFIEYGPANGFEILLVHGVSENREGLLTVALTHHQGHQVTQAQNERPHVSWLPRTPVTEALDDCCAITRPLYYVFP